MHAQVDLIKKACDQNLDMVLNDCYLYRVLISSFEEMLCLSSLRRLATDQKISA